MYKLNSFRIHMYIECINWYAKAIQFIHSMYMRMRNLFNWYIRCTCVYETYSIDAIEYLSHTHYVHRMYKLNSFRIHMYIECINWIALAYTMRKLFNWCIRCTCVCETYSIYTFDVHVYAKAIQFIHSMYMCMRKLFNLYIRCHLHWMIKFNSFRKHMYTCTSNV
jgi:hypothetical protein